MWSDVELAFAIIGAWGLAGVAGAFAFLMLGRRGRR